MTNSRQPIPRKKKSATSRRSPRKTTKKAVRTTMPIWLRNVLFFLGGILLFLY